MANVNLHRGDDTDSFDGGLFKIDYSGSSYTIKKLELQIGNITKTYINPVFPLQVNLRSCETSMNPAGKYDINIVILDGNYRRLNIATGSTITFTEPNKEILLPYESVTLFDLAEILPTKQDSNTETETQNGTETENQTGEQNGTTDTDNNTSDTQNGSDSTDTQSGQSDNNGTTDNTTDNGTDTDSGDDDSQAGDVSNDTNP